MANKSKMLSLFSNLYKFSLPGISRCWCCCGCGWCCGCGSWCWCWNTTCNLPNQVDQESQPWRRAKGCSCCCCYCLCDVFVVVYDVPSNFLQLIACNTNNNRHFLTVLTSLCTFRFLHFMFFAIAFCLDLVAVPPPPSIPSFSRPLPLVCVALEINLFACVPHVACK